MNPLLQHLFNYLDSIPEYVFTTQEKLSDGIISAIISLIYLNDRIDINDKKIRLILSDHTVTSYATSDPQAYDKIKQDIDSLDLTKYLGKVLADTYILLVKPERNPRPEWLVDELLNSAKSPLVL